MVVPGEHFPGTSSDSLDLNMVSAHLREMREPALWESRTSPLIAARLFIGPDTNPPVSVRLQENRDGSWAYIGAVYPGSACWDRYTAAELEELGDVFPSERVVTPAGPAAWPELERVLWESGFWSEPGFEPEPHPDDETRVLRLHATQFALELRTPQGYYFILRESGSPFVLTAGFSRLCNYFLTHSGLSVEQFAWYCPDALAAQQGAAADVQQRVPLGVW